MNDYERIARVIRYLDEHHQEQPDLETLAEHLGLSSSHFHRLFSSWAGITPKDFLQSLTLSHAKQLLSQGKSVLDATLDVGLSSPGRLHDLCVNLEAASPGELKSGGEGWKLMAGFVETPFGTCLVGESPRGICHLSFVSTMNREVAAATMLKDWPKAQLQWDDVALSKVVDPLFRRPERQTRPLRAFMQGTSFQVRVWRALLAVPSGTLVSYGQLATAVGQASASRAVGTAVGRNSLAYLIPCHRVIRETGVFGNYRWDPVRKRAMVAWESSTVSAGSVMKVK
jgi:AraC family transcriptional regulator, regulatory protein of adaptative response / methylated-DNA-[protein]-cysteine methyltransferase